MNLFGDSSDSVSAERPPESVFTETESDSSGRGFVGECLKRLFEKPKLGVRKELQLAENTTAIVGGDYSFQNGSLTPVAKIIHDVNEDGTLEIGWRKLKYSQRVGQNLFGRRFSAICSASIRYDDELWSSSVSCRMNNASLQFFIGSGVVLTGHTFRKKIVIPAVPQTETTSGLDFVSKLIVQRRGAWADIALKEPRFILKLGPKTPPLLADPFPKSSNQDDAEERTK